VKKIDFILPIISGLIIVFAFPGTSFSWLAVWVAFIPLFIALKNKNFKQSFLIGLIFGSIAYLGFLRWIPSSVFHLTNSIPLSVAVLFVACIYPVFSIIVFCVLYGFINKHIKLLFVITVPSLWVALEFLQFHIFRGFPWVYNFLGHTQWNNIFILQIVSFTGVLGISFLIILVNFCLYLLWENKKSKQAILGLVIFAICLLYGFLVINFKAPKIGENKNDSIKVVILDGNVDSTVKWQDKKKVGNYIADTYLNLNVEAAKQNPNLIVWTETAIPWPMADGDNLVETALSITKPSNAYHIIGMPSYADNGGFHDTVFFVEPDGLVTDEYDKVNLLGFLENRTSWISKFIKIGNTNSVYVPGTKVEPLNTPLGKIGTLICNENIYQDYVRDIVRKGAEFILVVGNDSLINNNIALGQHLHTNYFRAVESGRNVVFAVNSGASGLIDEYGRMIFVSSKNASHIISVNVNKRNGTTFYTKFGDVFSYFCIFLSLLSIGFAFYYANKEKHYER